MSLSETRSQQDSQSSPALRVPNEILVEICRLNVECGLELRHGCREWDVWNNAKNRRGLIPPPLRDTISASQVCRQWRQALISSPQLWRYHINPYHVPREWTQLLLDRARPHGITYHRPFRRISKKGDFMLEVEYAKRLVSYAGYFRSNCNIWNYEGVPKKWLQLQFLCIAHEKTNPRLAWGDDEDEESDWLLPDDFPRVTSTPLLEQLHLHTCFVGKEEQIISLAGTLTELSVENLPPGLTFSASQWVKVIGSLPRLRRLSLCEAISPRAGEEEWNLGQHTPLRPELEEFVLDDDIKACVQILKQLDLTSTSRHFHLLCSCTPDDEAYTVLILSSVRETFSKMLSSHPLFQHCALSMYNEGMSCVGIPEGRLNDPSRTPQEEKVLDEVRVTIWFNSSVIPDWIGFHSALLNLFQVIWHRVDVLGAADIWENVIIDHELASIILERSGHRILKIDGVNIRIWNIIYHTIDPGHAVADTAKTMSPPGQFLLALEEVNLYRTFDLDPTETRTLFEQIVAFCKHKKAIGHPMRVIRNPPFARVGEAGDGLSFTGPLEELGVEIKFG